ncbi:MAG: hypothetical protein HKL96_00510 [Phycisphaerales bacterium]|nr:hypothetical protein [Phycisphaerales bacterium]
MPVWQPHSPTGRSAQPETCGVRHACDLEARQPRGNLGNNCIAAAQAAQCLAVNLFGALESSWMLL